MNFRLVCCIIITLLLFRCQTETKKENIDIPKTTDSVRVKFPNTIGDTTFHPAKNEKVVINKDNRLNKYSASSFYDSKILVDSNNLPLLKSQYYFPLKLFPELDIKGRVKKNEYNEFVLSWYSGQLFALREPLLFNKRINKEVFRFTWLRTFDNPIAIRIEKDSEKYYLYWKVCSGEGGYSPGELIIDKSKSINKANWDVFLLKINKLNFWDFPIGREFSGCDGAEWILEGANSLKYHVITNWGRLDCCLYLLELTDLEIPKEEIY